MMNYIKSEIYRVSHDKNIYFLTAVLSVLSFLLNFLLGVFGKIDGASFRYNTTSFSYSNLVANPMLFCVMGAVVGFILYEGNRRNGNLKNAVAFGIPRIKIFIGECMVSAISAIMSLIVVLAVYISSALLFLKSTGPVSIADLLTEVPAVLLLAIASLICGIVCIEAFEKASTGIIIWVILWFVIPMAFFYLGLRFDIAHDIAMWMPANFFGTSGMRVNMSQSITAWGTIGGMAKCIISGVIGMTVFTLSGILLLRKKEI